jgi:CDP-glycerol glycerophosphotransferase (TagB/SpsB family)
VAVPYGTNVIDGPMMRQMTFDMPLHRLGWRSYVSSPVQRQMYLEHCRTGADHVRVLGTPKLDRVLRPSTSPRAAALRSRAGDRPVVVWNPHFRIGEGGWSTFDRYVGPLLEHYGRHSDQVLLLRPHFRLFGDLARIGGAAARIEREVRAVAARRENIVLDEQADYLDALTVADAMISDLSSLATEFMLTGKPIALLHRADSPALNADGGYFDAMYRADTWPDVRVFLDMVRRGEDPRADERRAAAARHFGAADGRAGERAAADLVAGLLAELGLAQAPAA